MAFGPPGWRKLTGGLIAIAAIIGGALAIIAFARVGSVRGKTYEVYILADEASGILKGTDIWLQGQKVGVVKAVDFLPTDSVVHTVLRIEVMSEFQPYIRRDSRVEFKAGGTFVGAQVVALWVGSEHAPMLAAGDTLTRVSVIDPDLRNNELTAAGRDLPQIVGSLRAIGTDLSRTETQLTSHSSGLVTVLNRVNAFERRQNGKKRGTLSLLLRDRALADRAQEAISRADSLLNIARSPGTISRFQSDSSLRVALVGMQSQLSSLRQRIADEDGAAGRFLDDDALRKDMEALENQISKTVADIARAPTRYSPFE